MTIPICTHDQMVQAARSGVQNIAEGSQASGTSKKTEMKLTNVAWASLEELRLDYCQSVSAPDFAVAPSSVLVANAALSLLNLCCHFLDRQLATQAKSFENEGGFTERLYRIRNATRKKGK